MVGIFSSIREEGEYKFSDAKQDNLFSNMAFIALISNADYLQETFLTTLEQGYEKRAVKEVMGVLTISLVHLWILNFYLVKHSGSISEESMTEAEIYEKTEAIKTDKTLIEVKRYSENPFKYFAKKKFQPHTIKYFTEMKAELKKHDLVIEPVLSHIKYIIERCLIRNAKLDKNDVEDMLTMYSLSLEGFKILSLDKKVISALEIVDTESFTYIKSLGI